MAIVITEDKLIGAIHGWLEECDADELARMAGEMFGGSCHYAYDPDESLTGEGVYEFIPNENYYGTFGETE